MFSQFMSSSPALGSLLSVQSLLRIFCPPTPLSTINKHSPNKVSSIFSKSLKATVIILSSISIAPFTGYKTLPHLFITRNQEVGISAIFRNEVIGIQASFSKVPRLGGDGTKMLACLLISNTALGALCSSCLSLRDQDLFTSFPSFHLRIGHRYFTSITTSMTAMLF